jgi:hypothetical protein
MDELKIDMDVFLINDPRVSHIIKLEDAGSMQSLFKFYRQTEQSAKHTV